MHRLRSRLDLMAGGLAQLVERLLCKQDVSGSSPLTSINAAPQTGPGVLRDDLAAVSAGANGMISASTHSLRGWMDAELSIA